jgi:hypothetical protein
MRELDDLKESEQQKLEGAQRAREKILKMPSWHMIESLKIYKKFVAEELIFSKEGNAALEEEARHNERNGK